MRTVSWSRYSSHRPSRASGALAMPPWRCYARPSAWASSPDLAPFHQVLHMLQCGLPDNMPADCAEILHKRLRLVGDGGDPRMRRRGGLKGLDRDIEDPSVATEHGFKVEVWTYTLGRSTTTARRSAKPAARPAGAEGASASSKQGAAAPGGRVCHLVQAAAIRENRWQLTYLPYSRISRSWALYREQGALNRVRSWAWHQQRGITREACPIAWLHDADWRAGR